MKNPLPTFLALSVLAISTGAAETSTTEADNSARNERDRSGQTVTAMDQSNDEADLHVVTAIRKALIAHDTLSIYAKNVKVITDAKRVVMRGPVNSTEEKTIIERLAKENAQGRTVENLIEVETP